MKINSTILEAIKEDGLHIVDDPDGKWHPESDHNDKGEAATRVHWLNGGQMTKEELVELWNHFNQPLHPKQPGGDEDIYDKTRNPHRDNY